MRIIIGDTETTGLGPTRRACEVALIEIDWDLNILGEAESLLNPERPIDPTASEIHGISNADVAHMPTMAEWVEWTFGGRLEGDFLLVGYRCAFDRPMIAEICDVVDMYDVLTLAQRHVGKATPNHKLSTMKEHFGLEGGPAHRAMGDVLTTHQLLRLLLAKEGKTLHQVTNTFQMVLRCPPVGGKNHTGKLLAEVPPDYRKWMLSLDDIDPNLRRTLQILQLSDMEFKPK